MVYTGCGISIFQSTPPVKAATFLVHREQTVFEISIHAAREGGDKSVQHGRQNNSISIHAAREGGDVAYTPKTTHAYISIHAAREGGDLTAKQAIKIWIAFQSTPPVKAATPRRRFRAGRA